MELQTEFEPIRDLLKEDESINSCMANLYYHTNVLEESIENQDGDKFDLILGRMVVNLTKLAMFNGTSIEYCINSAYQKILHPDGN